MEVTDDAGRWNGRTLAEWLPTVVADIVAAVHPERIVLFGSLARGGDGPDSDIDLLVIMKSKQDQPSWRHAVEIHRAVTAPVPLDIVVTDLDELARRGHLRSTIFATAAREGRVLHDAAGGACGQELTSSSGGFSRSRSSV